MDEKKYQIFVSSTFTDLKEERLAAMNAVIGHGHVPIGMEGFPAVDENQLQHIKQLIDECDYYILIVKNRYGSTGVNGISFTEEEYDYAVEKGKHILAFINDGEDFKSSDNEKLISKFKQKIETGRLIKNWDNKSSLELEIYKSLGNAFNKHPQIGWVRGDAAITSSMIIELENARAKIKKLEESKPLTENTTLKLTLDNDEIACFQSIVAETNGLHGVIPTLNLEKSMERLGYEALSTKLSLNKLKSSRFISVNMIEHEFDGYLYEALQVLELGWNWIEHNKQKFTSRIQAPNFANDDLPF